MVIDWSVPDYSKPRAPLHSQGGLPDRLKFRVQVAGDIGEWLSPIEHVLSDSSETPETPTWLEIQCIVKNLMSWQYPFKFLPTVR
jgi:hypothetical protein